MYKEKQKSVTWLESQAKIAELKKDENYLWLKEVNSQSLQLEARFLEQGFKNFFKKSGGYPKKKKFSQQSFTAPQNIVLEKTGMRYDLLILPKFKDGIKIRAHRYFDGEIKRACIVKDRNGAYFANLLVEREEFAKHPEIERTVGIDLGLTAFIVDDFGEKVPPPKFLRKMERRLVHAQRRLSKKRKRSSNYEKARQKVSILHQKVRNQRKDFLHQLSSEIIRENQVIYFEDLNVAGMVRNHKLAKSIIDASWSMFVQYVLYKADWYGRKVVFIDRFAPTSKLCSQCGAINEGLKLSDRVWTCLICKTEHDRDINAARNIKKLGQDMSEVKPVERTASTFLTRVKQAGSRNQEPNVPIVRDAR